MEGVYLVNTCAAVQVHEGMMQAATFVHTNAYEALQAAAERFPGWPVMLTGHSMGGMFPYTLQFIPTAGYFFLDIYPAAPLTEAYP